MPTAGDLKKIVIVGNAAGGKTVLGRRLADLHGIPLFCIDSLQFKPGLVLRPFAETLQMVETIRLQDSWILDGFGPLDNLEKRFASADRIVWLDWPLWQNWIWFCKRQLLQIHHPRPELPAPANELTWTHTQKTFDYMWKVHTQMRPELARILNRAENKNKLSHIQNQRGWRSIYKHGLLS